MVARHNMKLASVSIRC